MYDIIHILLYQVPGTFIWCVMHSCEQLPPGVYLMYDYLYINRQTHRWFGSPFSSSSKFYLSGLPAYASSCNALADTACCC